MATKNEELFAKASGGETAIAISDRETGTYDPPVQGFAKESGNIGSTPKPYPTTPFANFKKGG